MKVHPLDTKKPSECPECESKKIAGVLDKNHTLIYWECQDCGESIILESHRQGY